MSQIIQTRNKPHRSIVKEMTAQNCVRAYRCSPEDVMLQIRREKEYAAVTLTLTEALELADILKTAAAKHQINGL